ncbi:bifunctional aspartate kinase/homoserine dehydrogenase I [Polaribacter reichenbachii]|uniref:Bifunctional aspartokinase I/homoserine dehydrogenase I n=1 Tax=Polaribacter reichenbachii TaxID=996801 RepID=A0A1B8U6L2_9FLAO|nr:bifunctional aspartate kinase/homoserine dehydrogenase I [Polaribacter reichenbachii]APZ46079.1 bifunctional aspartate kinase/homoserine dehydrogenase I [Polaribacter reichenbachii]AUC19941.1 bifunctional aspartate kinase/homoserine dehydrogenase I [Polaribacter reichenbachii]OBY67514.1 bifunctional aspartokinase I/homoserine dehydrogenase I [Polaribacter reichenbachii]
MKVLKFGGSSVANSEKIKQVLSIIAKTSEEQKVAVIVSAFGKTTDKLLAGANEALEDITAAKEILELIKELHFRVIDDLIIKNKKEVTEEITYLFDRLISIYEGIFLLQELSNKTLAKVSSFGERLSSYIIAKAAKETLDATHKESRDLIITNDEYLNAQVNFEVTNKNIAIFFHDNQHKITVLGGFISSNTAEETTTLGRGGSDFSAAIYAAALNADELQIWTDVSGMFTANPRIVKQAYPIAEISYEEAMELSHFGAKVLYPPTIQPALRKEIPIRIKNTFDPENFGTLISNDPENGNEVKGISHIEDISLITLEGGGMIGIPGFSKRLFEALSVAKINVVFITQASSEHSICVGVYDADAEKAKTILDETFSIEIYRKKIKPIIVENDLAIIAVVGESMKNYQGLSGQMFSALGRNNVNVRAIAQGSSEKNISAVINKYDAKKALNTLHEQFFEERTKQLNLFVTGVGNVGERFLAQLHQQKKFLIENLKLNIRVIGISNSRKMVFDDAGINLENWKDLLENGEPTSLDNFYIKVKEANHRNSVFVDNTANQAVSEVYEKYLKDSISVVTCNKIACASSFYNYKKLKEVSKKYNASFLFETNVGAGLPIIDTLKNLVNSGDRIHKIQAVLSGSLNFVFNNFDQSSTFHNVVAQAQKEGYTEPDPKIDLSGVDVARKILILARESSFKMELEDIKKNAFLPEEALNTTNNDDFYAALTKHENHFQDIFKQANDKDCRLKYVAEFVDGKANVGLQHIPADHPFYNLEGSDNIVLFFTDRYPENPLIIKGAGAGADVTASGIFADIIRIANK